MEPGAFCREVESYLCRKNDGHLIRIVGPAFELVCGWAAAGIPLRVVERAIDRRHARYYARGPRRRPLRIEYCEADVLELFDEWRRAVGVGLRGGPGPDPDHDSVTLEGPAGRANCRELQSAFAGGSPRRCRGAPVRLAAQGRRGGRRTPHRRGAGRRGRRPGRCPDAPRQGVAERHRAARRPRSPSARRGARRCFRGRDAAFSAPRRPTLWSRFGNECRPPRLPPRSTPPPTGCSPSTSRCLA